jgi:hypothetical protein
MDTPKSSSTPLRYNFEACLRSLNSLSFEILLEYVGTIASRTAISVPGTTRIFLFYGIVIKHKIKVNN